MNVNDTSCVFYQHQTRDTVYNISSKQNTQNRMITFSEHKMEPVPLSNLHNVRKITKIGHMISLISTN